MTIRDAKLEVAKLGMVLSKTEHGEFRVNFKGGSEATAYYTDDLDDAVGTARLMSKEKPKGSRSAFKWGESPYKVEQLVDGTWVVEDEHGTLLDGPFKNRVDAIRVKKELEADLESGSAETDKVRYKAEASRLVSRMDRLATSQALDRISDHIEGLRQQMPREASNLRGLALRLDRVANTLEAEQEVTERVSKIENELDDLGVDFTVEPTSASKQATCIYAYKGQLNSRDEASVLGRIAKKHGSLFENMRDNRTYKITVPHHV